LCDQDEKLLVEKEIFDGYSAKPKSRVLGGEISVFNFPSIKSLNQPSESFYDNPMFYNVVLKKHCRSFDQKDYSLFFYFQPSKIKCSETADKRQEPLTKALRIESFRNWARSSAEGITVVYALLTAMALTSFLPLEIHRRSDFGCHHEANTPKGRAYVRKVVQLRVIQSYRSLQTTSMRIKIGDSLTHPFRSYSAANQSGI